MRKYMTLAAALVVMSVPVQVAWACDISDLACYAKKNCKIKFRNHTGEGSGDGEGMQRSLANSISVSAQAKTTLSATKERLPQGKR